MTGRLAARAALTIAGASQPTARYVAIPAARNDLAHDAAIAFSCAIDRFSRQDGYAKHTVVVVAQFCKADMDMFFVRVNSFVRSPRII